MKKLIVIAAILAPSVALWAGCAAKKTAPVDGMTGATSERGASLQRNESAHDKADAVLVIPGEMSPNTTYTVQAGDTLASISERFYGTSNHWKDIVHENKTSDPRQLKTGMVLKIPDLKDEDSRSPAPELSE